MWYLLGPQELYCEKGDVDHVNEVLKGKGHVYFAIDRDDQYEGLYRVIPRWIPVQSNDEDNYHFKMNERNHESSILHIWTDCGRTSAAVVGSPSSAATDCVVLNNNLTITSHPSFSSKDLNEGQQLATGLLFHIKGELEHFAKQKVKAHNMKKKIQSSSTKQPSNFLSGIQGFDKSRLQPQETIVRSLPQVETSLKSQISENRGKLEQLWKQYADIFLEEPEGEFFKTNGLNQYLLPEIGDSLVVMPATLAPQWMRLVPPPTLYSPNFHYAPVCFVTKEHQYKYITLESFSTLHKGGTSDDCNTLWEFREYIAGTNESYHSKAHLSTGYGNVTITLRLQSIKL